MKTLCAALSVAMVCAAPLRADDPGDFIDAVRRHGDFVITRARDTYGDKHTPLFTDGFDRTTLEPAVWKLWGKTYVISNFAGQQNLMRTLAGLTALTGEPKYKQAAADATRYMFDNLRSPGGLLYWGGHTFYALNTDTVIGEQAHELKSHYPYYELMYEVDPDATRRFVEAFWHSHVLAWSHLGFNRHGNYDYDGPLTWQHGFHDPPAFHESWALTFSVTADDMIFAAGQLDRLADEPDAWTWAMRLNGMFEKTRHPKTGLVAIQFTRRPGDADRAQAQFGPEFGPDALDCTILPAPFAYDHYAVVGICDMLLGRMMGEKGNSLAQRAADSLKAYAAHAYDVNTDTFLPLFTDGRVIIKDAIKREGYYFETNGHPARLTRMDPLAPDATYFWAYVLAYRLTNGAPHLDMVQRIGKVIGVDITADAPPTCADPEALFGLLELYEVTGDPAMLTRAVRVGRNILAARVDQPTGAFVEGERRAYIHFNALEPLALLHLAAALQGKRDALPTALASRAEYQQDYDGKGARLFDSYALWDVDW